MGLIVVLSGDIALTSLAACYSALFSRYSASLECMTLYATCWFFLSSVSGSIGGIGLSVSLEALIFLSRGANVAKEFGRFEYSVAGPESIA